MSETGKPLLLIDVDGPLNPWAASNNSLRKGKVYHRYKLLGFQVWLNRRHGEELLKLTDVYDLVWCTTWEHEANSLIGPRIGLPELPVIEFKKFLPEQPPEPGLHWKTAVIAAYATAHNRPFAWVDDEASWKDGLCFARWCGHPFLTKTIDPAVGLVDQDFAELRDWAEGGMYGDDLEEA